MCVLVLVLVFCFFFIVEVFLGSFMVAVSFTSLVSVSPSIPFSVL